MVAANPFALERVGPDGPALGFEAVTPADAELPTVLRVIRIGQAAGSVSATDLRGITTVIPNVEVGEYLPGPFARINATGTTATGIVGWI